MGQVQSFVWEEMFGLSQGTLKGGSITVRLASCLTGLEMYFAFGALNFVRHRGAHF